MAASDPPRILLTALSSRESILSAYRMPGPRNRVVIDSHSSPVEAGVVLKDRCANRPSSLWAARWQAEGL